MAAIEKLIVAQLVSKFAALCASRFFHCLVHWSVLSAAYTLRPSSLFTLILSFRFTYLSVVSSLMVLATECSHLLSPPYSVLRRISLVIVCDYLGIN